MLGGGTPSRPLPPVGRRPVTPPGPATAHETRPTPAAASASGPSHGTAGHVPGEVGIWVFILGDLLVFAIFFGVFMVERGQSLEEFRAGRESLNTLLGVLNTLLLLTGSILVVLGLRAVRDGAPRLASRLILGAGATGVLFVVNKVIEYGEKLDAGVTPGDSDFYTLFFAFTGIHLLHLLIGLAALLYLNALARRPQVSVRDLASMESCASYWHLVDLLWLVLFPLFYLVA
ncbi:hypothetical protein DSM112329_01983 [Paraconexibacter sp. AEG42_29]|uniref:Cytochrome aa3 subunit 3 n=1 Tax=Paraconexibacter sp. AEG42_29 TaxID=2997339 RepID=A0AAU7AUW1_9ACTN